MRLVRCHIRTLDQATSPPRKVAIIGTGFSGSILAAQLLSQSNTRVVLFERDAARVTRGVAYSSANRGHLLNVRAGNMSAFADQPTHFVDWLGHQQDSEQGAFVTRETYGRYLTDIVDCLRRDHPERLELSMAEVVGVQPGARGITITTGEGQAQTLDAVVLAIGNLPPHDPPGAWWETLSDTHYQRDPWKPSHAPDRGAPVILLGTGLTAIDVALQYKGERHEGPILALSRRGLRPHRHVENLPHPTPQTERPAESLSALVKWVRQRAGEQDWRLVIDSLRGLTPLLWSALDIASRRRFPRHLRPYWDVHRHRLAPDVADRIDAMIASGQLAFAAGTILDVTPSNDGVCLTYRRRCSSDVERVEASRIVNCTGPQGDLSRARDPLIVQVLEDGHIRADALGIGIDIDGEGRVIGKAGAPASGIYALGPMTRGAWWEAVAVPDIRNQAAKLARRMCNEHWVEGEGL